MKYQPHSICPGRAADLPHYQGLPNCLPQKRSLFRGRCFSPPEQTLSFQNYGYTRYVHIRARCQLSTDWDVRQVKSTQGDVHDVCRRSERGEETIMEVMIQHPQRLLIRVLIAVLVFFICPTLYPYLYCHFTVIC